MYEKLNVVEAVRLERSLCGASSSVLAVAEDGFKYVVKWKQNNSGNCIAFREAFGTSVFATLGIMVPVWKPIYLSQSLIDADQHKCLDRLGNGIGIAPGIHFASRCVSEEPEDLYRTLPGSWYDRVKNRADFWGSFVIDLWLNASRPRQSLFLKGRDNFELLAIFVSHSGISFARHPDMLQPANACFYPDMRAYPDRNALDTIDLWIDRVRNNGERAVLNALAAMPSDWKTASTPLLGAQLVDRISKLQERVYRAFCSNERRSSTKPPQSVESSRLIESSGLHLVRFSAAGR